MATRNLEVGVHRALKAYKMEGGMSDADADAWATSHRDAGVAQVQAAMAGASRRGGSDAALEDAFAALKTWSQS